MAADLQKTPLHGRHVELGARMVEFGGWHMPLQYKLGIKKEHQAVRAGAGLFDVSHMGEVAVRGAEALTVVQRVVTNDAGKLADGDALYTVMCNQRGGIIDDCIVYRRSADDFLIVVNASNIAKDRAWIVEAAGSDASVEDESDATALIALQGPNAIAIADAVAAAPVGDIARFTYREAELAGVRCTAARTGYTGEDGFELACRAEDAVKLWDGLLEAGAGRGLEPIGLGARDTLRLEARLCLYGNDIDETTTPYEAGLGWVVKPSAKEFIGREALLAQKEAGIPRRLIGFRVEGRGIPRPGYNIIDRQLDGDPVIGRVTSGTTGITVGAAIGMGYVPTKYSEPGTQITVDCRGKDVTADVVKGPFYRRGDK